MREQWKFLSWPQVLERKDILRVQRSSLQDRLMNECETNPQTWAKAVDEAKPMDYACNWAAQFMEYSASLARMHQYAVS